MSRYCNGAWAGHMCFCVHFCGVFVCIWGHFYVHLCVCVCVCVGGGGGGGGAFSWAFYGCFVCILVNFVTWWVSKYYITSVYDRLRLRLRQILFNINGYKYHIRFTCIWSKIQITVYSWYIIKHRHVRRPPLRSDLTAGMEATRRGKACTAMFILKTTSC